MKTKFAPLFAALTLLMGVSLGQAQTFYDYSATLGGTTSDQRWTGFVQPSGVTSGTGGTAGEWAGTTTATNNGIHSNSGSSTDLFYVPLTGTGTALDPADNVDFLASGGGIYSFFSQTHYTVSSSTPVSGLQSMVLQLSLATGLTGALGGSPADFSPTGAPILTLSLVGGGTANLAANFSLLESSVPTFIAAFNTNTTVNTYGYQWDLSAYAGTITSYTVDYQVAYHSIMMGADSTQSTALNTANTLTTVPEPSTYALMVLGLGALGFFRWKKTALLSAVRSR